MTFLANDKEVLRLYNMREMAQIDYNSGMKKVRDERSVEIARNLLEMNMPHDQIAKATGLTLEVIQTACELPAPVKKAPPVHVPIIPKLDFNVNPRAVFGHRTDIKYAGLVPDHFRCKLPEKDIKNDSLHRWLTFFDQNISDDTLKELMDMDAAIYKANEKMTFLANDKEVLRLIRLSYHHIQLIS